MSSRAPLSLFGLVLVCLAAPVPASAQSSTAALPIELVPIMSHSASITSVAFSPDGARILTVSIDNSVKLWDVKTGRLIRTFGVQATGGADAAAFSPNGTQIAIWGADKILKLWDASTGRLIQSYKGHAEPLVQVWFSQDGSQIASVGQDKAIKLWQVATGQLISTTPMQGVKGDSSKPITFSPDGSLVASTSITEGDKAPLSIRSVATGKLVRNYTFTGATKAGSTAWSAAIKFLPDNKQVLTGGTYPMTLWDITSGRVLRTFGRTEISEIALSPDGRRALTGDVKGMKLWEIASGALLQTFPHPEQVSSVAFSPDGKHVLSQAGGLTHSADGTKVISSTPFTAKLWDAATGQLVRTFGGQSHSVNAIGMSADGSTLASGGDDKIAKIWDAATGQLVRTLGEHTEEIASIAFSRDGTRVAASAGRTIAFSLDSARVASASDSAIRLWEATSGRLLRTVTWPSPGKDSTKLNLWETASGRLVRTFAPTAASWASWVSPTVNSAVLSPDGNRILIGGDDNSAKLLDTASGRILHSFQDSNGIWSAALSPDGTRIATGSFATLGTDKSIKLWDATNGRLLRKLEGHTDGVRSVAFAMGGTHILSGSNDATIKLWNVATGQVIRTFTGHLAAIKSVVISADGTRLISASDDTTIKIWDMSSGNLLVSLLGTLGGEWLAVTPEGFFAASEKGAELLSLVRGFDVDSVDQFYQSLYRPDLVREKIAGDPRGVVREAAAKLDLTKVLASGNAPSVTLAANAGATGDQIALVGEIVDRGGGIGRVEWRVNGVTVGIETPAAPPAGQPLRLTRNVALEEGENEIEVVAYNRANLIASAQARVQVVAQAPATRTASRMFVLAVGLNDYAAPSLQLTNAVADAKALAAAFSDAGKGMYQSVEVLLVQDADVRRGKLDAIFTELATKVRPTDVFVFFLGGHGKTVDGRYYFIPQDFAMDGVTTPAALETAVVKQGISQEQWQTWFARIAARKSLLLFDTCESGSLTGDGKETRALERGAANDRLVQATGRTILTASSDDTDAFEGFGGHGLFTYNVLEALERADSDGNGRIEVAELATYVYAQVTALSEKVFKQRQVPQVRITGNYSLAKPTQIFAGKEPGIVISAKATHQTAAAAELLVLPAVGARRVRKLDAKTPVTLVKSDAGWTLVAREGRPIGFVAAKDLSPVQ
jgi:WD40 repeat protein/uncharacterized caspase-like protein